jgi:Domain of unknown function (DUF4082)/Bacterial Ig domain/Cohesin domain
VTAGASAVLIVFGWLSDHALPAARTFLTATGPCDPPIVNPIVCENTKPGNPSSEWDVSGAGDPGIQGFATEISVDHGETVFFKISTPAASYRVDIYRLGYYGGMGARRVATVFPSAIIPQSQPACLQDSPWSGLRDCGNWSVSASWVVPADATSGIYIARPVRLDTGGASHIPFVVRDDEGHSDLLFQTSDTTWQAYNRYGGNDLYGGDGPATNGRANRLSYNRPFTTRADHSTESVFNAEYPMVRWLEANGYSVSYSSAVDTDRRGSEILEHKVFLSVGHDEYVSGGERTALETAREAGVHLAFFSGNEVYWKIRWENSIDGSGAPYRTLVCYKEGTLGENNCGTKCDPLVNVWTGLWRDGCAYSPPADGCRPENSLSGQISWDGTTYSMDVPAADGKMRFWRGTAIASLSPGQIDTLPTGTLGYEWDFQRSEYEALYPPGRVWLSTSLRGGKTHHLTLYRHPGGALVFGAGTVQWSWGLDSNHDRGNAPPDLSMQQATVNLFADMGVQAWTLQAGLVPASTSTDGTPPTSQIYAPLSGSTVLIGGAHTISGLAADSFGGVVGGVEVSVDGGTTWHPATGRESWSYVWTPAAYGAVTILSRAVDDSGNLENPGAGITVTVGNADAPPPDAPVAAGDSYTTDQDLKLSVPAPGVLANDSDPNGDPLVARLFVGPAHGSLALSPDGSFAYTPASGYRGTDGFQYVVLDPSNNRSAPATVSIGVGLACPCSFFPPTTVPASPHFADRPVTLGVKIRSDVDGRISGLRFYKDPLDTGSHVGQIWTRSGTLLSSVTFAETSSGWQQTDFAVPVPISANTTYVAAYHTSTGYPQDTGYFTAAGVDIPPLHALQDGVDGGNGVYAYDPTPGVSMFPNQSFQGSNYYVDVVFEKPNSRHAGVAPDTVEAQKGDALTVSVVVDLGDSATGLGSYDATLSWNPDVLQFLATAGGDAPFDSPSVNASGAAGGSLSFSDADAGGATGRFSLLTVTFRAMAEPCVTTPLHLAFTTMQAPVTFEDFLPSLGVADGTAVVDDFSMNLRVEDAQNTTVSWDAPALVPPPAGYDVIRGFIGALYDDGVTVHLGPVTCVENDSLDTTTAAGTETAHPDTGLPAPGRSFFYLVRFHNAQANQSYGFRDRCAAERKVDSGDCP